MPTTNKNKQVQEEDLLDLTDGEIKPYKIVTLQCADRNCLHSWHPKQGKKGVFKVKRCPKCRRVLRKKSTGQYPILETVYLR